MRRIRMPSIREVTRRERILQILNTVEKHNRVIKEKLIGGCCFEWGTSRRTTLEYIDTLIKSGKIKQEGDELCLVQ